MGTIVVGYDDKDPARRALERAIEEAKRSGDALVVVSVLEMPLNPEGPQYFGTLDDSPAPTVPPGVPPELEPVQAHAKELLASAGARAQLVWGAGEPAHEIVQAARDRNASLVVVGSHHHSLLGRLFRNDVAAEVERELGSRVIVVE